MSIRRPPLPHWDKGEGFCRWCGGPTEISKRGDKKPRLWHDDCHRLYFIATSSASQRRACFERDKGICCKCGTDTHSQITWKKGVDQHFVIDITKNPPQTYPSFFSDWPKEWPRVQACEAIEVRAPWAADHNYPLWLVDKEQYPECLKYWHPDNLQTLCDPCHKIKTAEEAGSRAKGNRILKRRGTQIVKREPTPFQLKAMEAQKAYQAKLRQHLKEKKQQERLYLRQRGVNPSSDPEQN